MGQLTQFRMRIGLRDTSWSGRSTVISVHPVPVFLALGPLLLCAISTTVVAAPQNSNDGHSTRKNSASLRVRLRMEDGSPFSGLSSVRAVLSRGDEIVGSPTGADGETIFADMPPGTHTVEATAPGFLPIRRQVQLEGGGPLQPLLLTMKPKPLLASARPASLHAPSATSPVNQSQAPWISLGINKSVPTLEPGVECPLPQVVSGVSQRMKELVDNLQKFDATEHLEHFNVGVSGPGAKLQARVFDYVAIITPFEQRGFRIDEYRNGSVDPSQFPAKIATIGLATLALIFHPIQISNFSLTCEGLAYWNGHPAWLVHFAQRADRPNLIRSYKVDGRYYPVLLKGRAWIDAGTYQVRRLETELVKPIPEIKLKEEDMAIDYAPVQFHNHGQQLWLPANAEVYWERRKHRFYRRFTYSNFKLFEVETAQQIQPPKESE